jgi:hypothetical protein
MNLFRHDLWLGFLFRNIFLNKIYWLPFLALFCLLLIERQ